MKPGKVLIVDDEPGVLTFLGRCLERAGYQVITRDNPVGTGAAIMRERPDLVIVDLNMPLLSGDEVVKLIRKSDNLEARKTRFVLHSSVPDIAERATACGANGFLAKPAGAKQILDIVQQHVSSSRSGDTSVRPLFVDDEENILKMYRRIFTAYPNAIFATSAREALAAIVTHKPDVVISDVLMPGMSGDELYRTTVAADPEWKQRFIFVTGHLAQEEVGEVLRGIDAPVFCKPTNTALLDLTIRRLAKPRAAA
jgi:DNA-binding NtrC family response regulator